MTQAHILRRHQSHFIQQDVYAMSLVDGAQRRALYVLVRIEKENGVLKATAKTEAELTEHEANELQRRLRSHTGVKTLTLKTSVRGVVAISR